MVHYRHPRPALAVDIVILKKKGTETQILLIQRANPPFQGQYALPGGFVEIEESLQEAAQRELQEETGLEEINLTQIGAFGAPDRDPRGRVVSIAYGGWLPEHHSARLSAADDAAHVGWYPLDPLPDLAFDHGEMIAAARQVLGV